MRATSQGSDQTACAQADLRLCWSHIPHYWKSHALSRIDYTFERCLEKIFLPAFRLDTAPTILQSFRIYKVLSRQQKNFKAGRL